MACDEKVAENERSKVNPILWASRKIQKVAVSTLSAEATSLAGSVDTLAWVRLFWAWMMDHRCEWKLGEETLSKLPPAFSALKDDILESPNATLCKTHQMLEMIPTEQAVVPTDCKSLFDLISKTAAPSCSEFRTVLQAKLIKEHLGTGVLLRWVPSGAQLADALTKIMDNTVLREILKLGTYKLNDEQEILKHRADIRTRVKWLRENSQEKPSRPDCVGEQS